MLSVLQNAVPKQTKNQKPYINTVTELCDIHNDQKELSGKVSEQMGLRSSEGYVGLSDGGATVAKEGAETWGQK